MKAILEEYGINTDALGATRINGLCQRLCREAQRNEGFINLSKEKHEKAQPTAETKLERRIRQLEHELAYAKQEVEFLKKLQQANTEAQKQWESKRRRK